MGNPGREIIPSHDEGKLDIGKRCFILEKPCFDIYFLLIFNNFFFSIEKGKHRVLLLSAFVLIVC